MAPLILRADADGFKPVTTVLTRFEKNLANLEPAMRGIGDYQARVVNQRTFDQRGPAHGKKWDPLTSGYAKWKANRRPGKPLMVFDGLLKESITSSPGIFETSHDTVVVGTAVEYAGYHQNGTPRMPARPLLGPTARPDRKVMVKFLQSFIATGSTSSAG